MAADRRDGGDDDSTKLVLHRSEASLLRKGLPPAPEIRWMMSSCSSGLFERIWPDPEKVSNLDKQTYQKWKALYEGHKISHPLRTRRNTIHIRPLAYHSPEYTISDINYTVMDTLHQFLSAFFYGMTINTTPIEDITETRKITTRVHSETNRTQILVKDIVKYLKKNRQPKLYCVVGLIIADMYPSPQWNFTLGHAIFDEGVAVCSYGRHFNSTVKPELSSLYQQYDHIWVILRVTTHEICHLFGLSHCYFFKCAMNESSSIDEAINQPMFLCPVCLRKLQKILQFDVKQRYLALLEQCHILLQITDDIIANTHSTECTHTSRPYIVDAIEWLERCISSVG